MLGKAGKVPHI